MNHRERFRSVFNFQPVDRIPVYFFGSWHETKQRWKEEGLEGVEELFVDAGPQVPGMDPDWEKGIWDCHGLVKLGPIGDIQPGIVAETDDYRIRRTAIGEVVKESKRGTTIPHTLEYGLLPERQSWQRFKGWMDVDDPRRWPADWKEKAEQLNQQDRVLAFVGGSLYGYLRGWMGIEAISFLMYDDPALFAEMVEFMSQHFMRLMEPVLKVVKFDLVYFFEDCCSADGPLFSPAVYRKVLDQYYQRMIQFYKANGVEFAMIDSDGNVDRLAPLWLASGFDIIFPIEVGKWKNSPAKMRRQFGENVKMIGGVDKHVIPLGEEAIRAHLMAMKAEVKKGGFLPMPDHRIPPECSYQQFLTYIDIFNEVFNEGDQDSLI
jgi:hypothetical protein